MSEKNKSKTKDKKQSENDLTEEISGSYDDSEYTAKISHSENYVKFLQLTHGEYHSDEDGSHGDLDGYMEDDYMIPAESECDAENNVSDLTEADEHLYGNLNSPTFETVENAGAEPQPQMSEEERQRQIEEWKEELLKVEEEIKTLRQVLGAKVRKASELKRMIGITPFQEFKQDFNKGIKQIQSSDTYQKTSSALHTASEKTNAVVSSVASSVTKKLGDIRNSPTFKSVEEKVGGAVANVKAKVAGSKSEDSFDEALKRETEAKGNEAANGTQQQTLPEEKIPL